MMADILRDARYAVRQLAKIARLLDRRGPHAGARHRRQQRDLQRRQRRAAAAAAVSRARRAGARQRDRAAVRPVLGRPGELPRLAAQADSLRAGRGVQCAAPRRFNGARGPSACTTALVVAGTCSTCCASRRCSAAASPTTRTCPARTRVIVLSHGMWQRRFGGDPHASLGRSLTLSGEPVTIVGVMPPGFYFPSRDVEFWRADRAQSRQCDARRPFPRRHRAAEAGRRRSRRRPPR